MGSRAPENPKANSGNFRSSPPGERVKKWHHLIPVMMKTGLSRGYHVVSRRFLVWRQINTKSSWSPLIYIMFLFSMFIPKPLLPPCGVATCSYHLSPSNSGFDRPGPQWVWPQWKGPGREATEKFEVARPPPILNTNNIVIIPIGSMVLLYMVTFTINIPPMLAYIPYMDPMGYDIGRFITFQNYGSHW